ncbi:DNA replication and repair protein RecN [Mobilisporobacter senegalensis]|uniref:DNA repair protein RecN n=1 Tax=Mobilisporobacter senegalensis TaxID=1329262 RepID=A0A3N1XK64_9FIRM|nr:DNA repair protein RecN [Mobilisporobacter senegalensis]ROR27109.1 DNA replication and repair protein RecN [Mobilisporobacter senegalensis]
MLLNLHVKNLAIINEVEVYFNDGLNIITGETGAGKSIIIGSINIALGGKVSKDMIRKGADYALVELIFQLEDEASISAMKEYDLPIEDGQIIISRKIMNGKNICRVNGENVTTSMLKDISGFLIDIHGQHEHQSLLYKKKHLEIIDRYSKDEIYVIKEQIAATYRKYIDIVNQLKDTVIDEEQRMREISFLEYEINEIEAARLKKDEDQDLAVHYRKLSNANMITEGLASVYHITGDENNESIGEGIGRATRILGKSLEFDDNLKNLHSQLSDIEDLMNSFNRELIQYMEDINLDEEEFKEVEARLDLINNLKSKYGNSIEKIQEYYESNIEKLKKYKDYDNYLSQLKNELSKEENELERLSAQLSEIRKKKGSELAKLIKEALIDLNFIEVQFEISFKKLDHYTGDGYDDGEFIISTNPGEDLKPLSKVSSGGELSRIMLAIKSVLADNDAIDTLIFDEIDVGVSGRTAQKVSEKLSLIGRNHQVLCITHLPQIAAMADMHYIIEKSSDGSSTNTTIKPLTSDDSVYELARMLGGAKITDTVINSAKEMKELATHTKKY